MLMKLATSMLLIAAVSACGGGDNRTAEHTAAMSTPADSDSTGMPMHGMPSRAIGSGTMAEDMRTHLRAMQAMSSDSARLVMPMHRQMATDMLAQMAKEMGDMKMPADARWTGLMDSVRRDVARMSEMSASELAAIMPSHDARITRLMTLHRAMTEQTPPPK